MSEAGAVTWITDPSALATLGDTLAQAEWVAIDTESNNRFVYCERVCLIQIHHPGGLVLIDPLEFPCEPAAMAPLAASFSRADQPLYLHGGEYDVACLKRDYDLALAGVFDSQQAATMLGFPKTGYGALVEELCGVELAKEHSQYDWGQRPIDADALSYAVDDVRYLPRVCQALLQRVREAGLEEEVGIANQAVMDADAHRTGFDPQAIYRIKGVGRLRPKQLALLGVLHEWRDRIAQSENVPAGRVVANEPLLQLAITTPTNFGSLKRIRLARRTLQRHAEDLLATIKTHRHDPPPPPEPPARRQPDPAERDREAKLKAWRRQEAERRGVPTQVVLPARALEWLKKHGGDDLDQVPQLGPKRQRLYGSTLRKLAT